MKNINNKNRVEQLKREIYNSNNNFQYHHLIIKLLNSGKINELIEQITDTKTKVNIDTLLNKNYLTGNEQFLTLLSNFIFIFKEDFYFLHNNFDSIVEILLQNQKYTKYFLCKKYIGNNDYLSYFSFNIRRLIVSGFYTNIKKLSKKSIIIKKFTKDNNINLRKNLINSKKGIDNLYNALLKISICNTKTLNSILLFENINHYTELSIKRYKDNNNKIKSSIYEYYIKEWENMIKNYNEKIDAINTLLK